MTDDRTEVLQGVLDRMTSYQDGAAEGTVKKELTEALDEVGLDLTDDEVDRAVSAIEAGEGTVSASSVLG